MEQSQADTPLKAKVLYPYQQADIDKIFGLIESHRPEYHILYQLPTGGGKTVVFAEIVRRFTETTGRKAIVLTHRNELCTQTSKTLLQMGVPNKRITSALKKLPSNNPFLCYVAMVETLKNRLREKQIAISDVGLVIIDEAHHNSFGKLLKHFEDAYVIGITATPLSSNADLPMNRNYSELITGESIASLIEKGYLAKAETYAYDVELNSLITGITGDYTVQSSDEFYSSPAMIEMLLKAYESGSKGKKTLIFNNGIFTSRRVCESFREAGYAIRHLDNKTPTTERAEILKWFRKTPGSILTSVSLLTTGFDEPSVQSVILFRATKSMTLYFQMIGRGSRRIGRKKSFTLIDLGNNVARFGHWNADIDWQNVFENPQAYLERNSGESETAAYSLPKSVRALFPNSPEVNFDIEAAWLQAAQEQLKPKTIIRDSLRQHAFLCLANSETPAEARALAKALEPDIKQRVKLYTQLMGKTTRNYVEWLEEDYMFRLQALVSKIFNKIDLPESFELKKV
ncbi:MAG: DEAD/DEAH box helicase [Flavobacterium sp.]|nr:MAG: DEAD/DEAH box helicase [Flavobacterium sp.]